MEIAAAQADLRRAYTDGGPGVIVSGLVWLAAYFVTESQGIRTGFVALFFGGMLIFPSAIVINRFLLDRPKEAAENPYGMLVLESTIAMIGMLFAAWLFLQLDERLVFPIAAIAIGTHYFAFKTAYGMKQFWALAASITALGFADIYGFVPPVISMIALVGIVEVAFGIALTVAAVTKK